MLSNWLVFAVYAAFMTLVTVICGQIRYGCQAQDKSFLCNIMPQQPDIALILSVCYLLIAFLLAAFFTYDFYRLAFKNEKLKWQNFLLPDKAKLKAAFAFIGYILCLIIPIVMEFLILRKAPHPDWRVEFIFFAVMFGFVVLNILTIRIFAGLSRFFQNAESGDMISVMRQTSGKSAVAVFLFLLFAGILNLLVIKNNGLMNQWSTLDNNWAVVLGAEFCCNLILLFCCAFMITFARAQDEILAEQDVSKNEDSTVEDVKPLSSGKDHKKAAAKSASKATKTKGKTVRSSRKKK